jgi:nicotinate-nucleotide pyrophosphorylase (carboxylating)
MSSSSAMSPRVSTPPDLYDDHFQSLLRLALAEDVGDGDITGLATVPPGRDCRARVVARAAGVVCGLGAAGRVFSALDPSIEFAAVLEDGDAVVPGHDVALVDGPARAVLAGERTALNFLQRLSGVASATARAVALVAGTGVELLDTRKTTPGMRALEKYAVACGGGRNHRRGLHDMFLVKENHVAMAGGIRAAVMAARRFRPGVTVEVEVRDLVELDEALEAAPDRIMVDNFSPEQAAEAVKRIAGRCEVEISGGVTAENLAAYAAARPNYISLGWLTHSAPALDLSLLIEA